MPSPQKIVTGRPVGPVIDHTPHRRMALPGIILFANSSILKPLLPTSTSTSNNGGRDLLRHTREPPPFPFLQWCHLCIVVSILLIPVPSFSIVAGHGAPGGGGAEGVPPRVQAPIVAAPLPPRCPRRVSGRLRLRWPPQPRALRHLRQRRTLCKDSSFFICTLVR
jgi:hypothetical protein